MVKELTARVKSSTTACYSLYFAVLSILLPAMCTYPLGVAYSSVACTVWNVSPIQFYSFWKQACLNSESLSAVLCLHPNQYENYILSGAREAHRRSKLDIHSQSLKTELRRYVLRQTLDEQNSAVK